MRAADRITADAWTIPPRRLEAMMVVNFLGVCRQLEDNRRRRRFPGAHSPDFELQQEIEDLE
jgi:hypothetical protein